MKKIIRCTRCSECVCVLPPGFTSQPYLWCTRASAYVGEDDGCTFGNPGTPTPGISQEVAIHGITEAKQATNSDWW